MFKEECFKRTLVFMPVLNDCIEFEGENISGEEV